MERKLRMANGNLLGSIILLFTKKFLDKKFALVVINL